MSRLTSRRDSACRSVITDSPLRRVARMPKLRVTERKARLLKAHRERKEEMSPLSSSLSCLTSSGATSANETTKDEPSHSKDNQDLGRAR
eukprot:1315153-Amphidinium_carterae.2